MLGVIHIGAEKTGTTTLQETFHLNRAALSAKGIYYPRAPGNKQHAQLAFYAMDVGRENIHTRDHPRFGGAHRDDWRKVFATALDSEISGAAGHEQLLISTELFHSQLVSTDEIARLKSLLDTWCSEYRIIFYMRRQDRLAVSLYSTRLRAAGNTLTVLPESAERLHYYDYRHILDLWGSVFGKSALRPRIFEKTRLQDQDLTTDFFSAARLPVEAAAMEIPASRNSALSRDAQTFLYRFNECTDRLSLSPPNRHRRTTRTIAAFLEDACDGPPSLPSRTAARSFCEPYRAGNEAVAREFFSQDSLFMDDFGMYPECEQPPDSLDPAQTMDMATQVIHHLANHSLWLDQQRIDRLLLAQNGKRVLDALALYLDEVSPELAAHLRTLVKRAKPSVRRAIVLRSGLPAGAACGRSRSRSTNMVRGRARGAIKCRSGQNNNSAARQAKPATVENEQLHIQDISTALVGGEHGMFFSPASGPVSYAAEGHAECFQVEDRSFWFQHRNNCIAGMVANHPYSGLMLDVGGGNGYVAQRLISEGREVMLLEPGATGARNARVERGLPYVACATVENAGFVPASFGAIGLFDVIEHIEQDRDFLSRLAPLLAPGGRLYLTVPCHQWLWSQADVHAGHFRRHTRASMSKLLDGLFSIDYFSYFFRPMIAPQYLLRALPYRLGIGRQQRLISKESEHGSGNGAIVRAVGRLLESEARTIVAGGSIGFGASAIVAAHRI